MEAVFLEILNMSITASYVILAVLFVRLLLKRAPKVFSYLLWTFVLFRLTIPFSFESIASLIPSANPLPKDILLSPSPVIQSGISVIDQSIQLPAPSITASVNPMQVWSFLGCVIWILGMLILLAVSMIAILRLKKFLKTAQLIQDNIYEVRNLKTPFVFGIIHPKIYLPSSLSEKERPYILLHEQIHIKRLDYLIKLAAFLVLALHWFHPLVWLSFHLFVKDMEESCDEAVIKKMGSSIKADYSASLLSVSIRQGIHGGPLAFGENNVKSRIKNVLKYRRPAVAVTVIAILLMAVIGICFLSNPKNTASVWEKTIYSYRTEYVGDGGKVSQISDKLQFPNEFERTGIRLHTTEEPYRLSIYYKLPENKMGEYQENQSIFDQNAIIAFSLIKNLDEIEFILNHDDDSALYRSVTRSRKWAEDRLVLDLWAQADSLTGFQALIKIASELPQPPILSEEEQFLKQLLESSGVTGSTASIQIPDKIPNEYQLFLHVSGSVPLEDGSNLSIHIFEEETEKGFQAGKRYSEQIFDTPPPDGTEILFSAELLNRQNIAKYSREKTVTFPLKDQASGLSPDDYVKAIYDSATIQNGIAAIHIPEETPEGYSLSQLSIEFSIWIQEENKAAYRVDPFAEVEEKQLWEQGKTYQKKVDSLPDHTEVYLNICLVEADHTVRHQQYSTRTFPFQEETTNPSVTITAENQKNQISFTNQFGESFFLELTLPKGFTLKAPEEGNTEGSQAPIEILESGKSVGVLWSNSFKVYPNVSDENFYRMVYSDLMLGSMASWDNEYTPIKQNEASETAICRPWHKEPKPGQPNAEAEEIYTKGILSYHKSLLKYIAISFEDKVVSDTQLREISESILLTDNNEQR